MEIVENARKNANSNECTAGRGLFGVSMAVVPKLWSIRKSVSGKSCCL